MFVSRTDSYEKAQLAVFRKYATTHAHSDFAEAFDTLQPVAVRYYNDTVFKRDSGRPETSNVCYQKPTNGSKKEEDAPCCHFSYHGPQFWGIGQCLQMVKDYEQLHGIQYRWVARVRPDTRFSGKQVAAVRRVTQETLHTATTNGRIWFRSNGGSDCFAVMTRAALDAYRTVWDEFMGGCETIGFKSPMVAADMAHLQQLCKPIGVTAWWGTECLIAAHLARPEYHVKITADNAFAVPIVRPTGNTAGLDMGGGRRSLFELETTAHGAPIDEK